jgi:peptidoglycan hydrolase-like protein with peptidoglycan-binding domain
MTLRLFFVSVGILFFVVEGLNTSAHASESSGTIDVVNKLTKICQNTACSVYGTVNWRPTINSTTPGAQAVAITDSGLIGHVWGDGIGWVNLAPTGGGLTINPTTGEVSGKAYANVGSWINFSPTTVGGGTHVGVTINSGGQFIGWAYVSGVHGGWMKFDCAGVGTCVQTDWRSVPNRTTGVPSGGGGGGGGFFGDFVATPKSKNQPTNPTSTPAQTTASGSSPEDLKTKACSMRAISPGTKHSDVASIQKFLIGQGYLFAALDATGYYGGGTKASIAAFQKKYYNDIVRAAGIQAPTGRWAEFTAKKAKELGLCLPKAVVPLRSVPPLQLHALCSAKTIQPGTRSSDVRRIQRFLIKQGYTLVEETGYYGPTTKQAISFFQRRFSKDILIPAGLTTPTGIWGKQTAVHAGVLGFCEAN